VEVVEEQGAEVVLRRRSRLGCELAQRVDDQVLLRGPAAVDRVLADAGAGGDGVHGRGLEAPLGEQRERRVHDRGSCVGATRTAPGPCESLGVTSVLRHGLAERSSAGIHFETRPFSFVKAATEGGSHVP
jgi:hypothetical protein